MSDEKNNDLLNQFLAGGCGPGADMGPADTQFEGTYRRGYHQAIAEVAFQLSENPSLSAEALSDWVEDEGMKWRKDTPLDRMIIAPAFTVK